MLAAFLFSTPMFGNCITIAILPHHKGGVSSSRLGIVRKRPLLSLAASVEAGRRPKKRSLLKRK